MIESMSSSSSAAAPKRLERPEVSASSRLFQSSGNRTLLLCLLLTAAVLVSYNPVIHNGFVNYDDGNIRDNSHVRAGLTWATVKWAFTNDDFANWYPLTWLSHAFDCELFGLNPAGPHYVNVLLHAANAVLLFLLLQNATGFRWRSLMVAALFALHPMNVESVAWASERKNVLSMLFFLFALFAYTSYARRPGLRRYAVVVFAFALALMSKPQVITFPFLLWLWDYWPLCRIGAPAMAEPSAPGANVHRLWTGWLVLEKVPLLLLSAASAVITMHAQKAGGSVKTLSLYSLPLRLETAVISYVRYLGKALWPSKLVALYPHPTQLYPVWRLVAAALLLLLIAVSVLFARNRRYLAVGWFWFLGSLVPMIGLVQVGAQAMADRYAYIPFIGLFLMLTWLAADWAKACTLRAKWLAVAATGWLLVLGTLTYRQVGYWHDIPSFWSRTLALTENNYIAHDTLGEYLASQGRTDEAVVHFRAALAIRPDDLPANLNLGTYEHGRGNLAAAIERYWMVALHAGDVGLRATAYGNLGSAYRQMGELVRARQCFEMALQLAPDRPMAMIGLGLIAQKNGDSAEAVRQYSRAMAVQPTDVGFLLLGRALQQEGRSDEAKAILERVARVSPNLAEAQATADALLSEK
ncbi:MAG: tetratricopeptide repeat protein [Terriglobales bacterium]